MNDRTTHPDTDELRRIARNLLTKTPIVRPKFAIDRSELRRLWPTEIAAIMAALAHVFDALDRVRAERDEALRQLDAVRPALNYIARPTMALPGGADAEEFAWSGATVDEVAAELRQARELREAVVYWNNDHSVQFETVRDEVVGIFDRNQDAIVHQPYNLADLVIAAVTSRYDKVDATLYAHIPEGEWGIALDNETCARVKARAAELRRQGEQAGKGEG